ncbi:hypothetical protein ABIE28_004274, partial [Devosia sp. 2618]
KRRTVGENFISQRRQRGRVVIETPKSVNNLFSFLFSEPTEVILEIRAENLKAKSL